jgi:hypothetical protein
MAAATPGEMVRIITTLDDYADYIEHESTTYRDETAKAIAAHAAAQMDAVRTLAGLVSQHPPKES